MGREQQGTRRVMAAILFSVLLINPSFQVANAAFSGGRRASTVLLARRELGSRTPVYNPPPPIPNMAKNWMKPAYKSPPPIANLHWFPKQAPPSPV